MSGSDHPSTPEQESRAQLQHVVDQFAAGRGRPEDVPDAAVRALVNGLETPAIIDLAGADRRDLRAPEIRALLNHVTDELGLARGTGPEAIMRLIAWVAADIVDAKVSAIDGAHEIYALSLDLEGDLPAELHPFVFAALEWDGVLMDEHAAVQEQLGERARELVARLPAS